MPQLIIGEKPQASKKIESATGVTTLAAVGHLHNLEKNQRRWKPPYFDIKWKPRERTLNRLDKILTALESADEVIIATDYDPEGQLIALNILRQANIKPTATQRMKFSSLEREELEHAYQNLLPFDVNLALSAEVRHYLDWYFGYNLSKTLTVIYRQHRTFARVARGLTPVGRVQSPTTKYFAAREEEVSSFVGKTIWAVNMHGLYQDNRTFEISTLGLDTKEKMKVFVTRGQRGEVIDVTKHAYTVEHLPPNKDYVVKECLDMKISASLADVMLQTLYLDELISYPRTSSRKYTTHNINTDKYLKRLVEVLPIAKEAIGQKPHEGEEDDIHPAIYPIRSYTTQDLRQMVWKIIAEAFVKCHLPPEEHTYTTCEVEIGDRSFFTREIPELDEGDSFDVAYSQIHEMITEPPNRYTQADVYEWMTKQNIGTKDTRSQILSKLLKTYLFETTSGLYLSAKGMQVVRILEKFSPPLVDVDLTRRFEEYTENVAQGKVKPEQVLKEARQTVTDLVETLFKHHQEIGKLLA